MQELYLAHHGIAGMKWGKRNGPPYPLDSSQKSSAEKKHYNVSAKQVKKDMDSMTDAELQRAINRINMQNQVNKLSPSIIQRGREKTKAQLRGFVAAVTLGSAVLNKADLLSKAFS